MAAGDCVFRAVSDAGAVFGSSLAFNLQDFRASLRRTLQRGWRGIMPAVRGVLPDGSAVLTFVGLLMIRETKDDDLLARGS